MGTTTFSGPIKAGTVREGASANAGFTLMAQSAVIDIIGATNTTTIGIVPANSQIVDAILNVTTVSNDGGTGVVQIGTTQLQTHPTCLLYTSPSPRDRTRYRMPSSA